MRWQGRRQSDNVEDRRGGGGGAMRAMPFGIGTIVIAGIVWALGGNPLQFLAGQMQNAPRTQQTSNAPRSPAEEEMATMTKVILADTEETWSAIFQKRGERYRPPTLVLFTNQVRSACGFQSSAVGPFYCPADSKVYIDLSFYDELRRNFGAPGDFAQAYVLAHEVGHHIQNLIGVSDQVNRQRGRLSKEDNNALSVRQELQADCFAGIWANHANTQRQLLEKGDVEEGLRAAAAIGDDNIQKKAQGYTVPESWTHGSSEMRVRWFKKGLQSGDINVCDTFNAKSLKLSRLGSTPLRSIFPKRLHRSIEFQGLWNQFLLETPLFLIKRE